MFFKQKETNPTIEFTASTLLFFIKLDLLMTNLLF